MTSELQDEIFYKEVIGREDVAQVILLLFELGGNIIYYMFLFEKGVFSMTRKSGNYLYSLEFYNFQQSMI